MEIPIQNIYFLLCYSWDKLAEKEIVNVEPIDSTSLVDLFARVLINGTHHLLKRGFDRGYVGQREWTNRLRGRVAFQDLARGGGRLRAKVPCEFEELSYDVLHNRILKTTLVQLLRTDGLNSEHTDSLTKLRRQFAEIGSLELTSRSFRQVQLHRNNQFYDFLLKVCELIHSNLLPSERVGHSKFRDFVRDERQMAMVYENFVRNFYRHHTTYRVKREDIYWKWIAADPFAQGLLPKMQTDVSLTQGNRRIIIDCKFTPQATQQNHQAKKLRSEHLYQIHAYLSNLTAGEPSSSFEIMLLYPSTGVSLSATYSDLGHKISVRTINLSQPWQLIHKDLLALVS